MKMKRFDSIADFPPRAEYFFPFKNPCRRRAGISGRGGRVAGRQAATVLSEPGEELTRRFLERVMEC